MQIHSQESVEGAYSDYDGDYEGNSYFDDSVSKQMDEYREYFKNVTAEHAKFSKQIESKWGDSIAVESSQKTWVEYNVNEDTRSVVDFETGKVKVEVLLSPEETDPTIVNTKLKGALSDMLTSKGKSSENGVQQNISTAAILEGQIDFGTLGIDISSIIQPRNPTKKPPLAPTVGSQDVLAEREKRESDKESLAKVNNGAQKSIAEGYYEESQVPEIAEEIVENATYELTEVVLEDGSKKIVASVQLELKSDHVSERAAKYKDIIEKHSATFNIDKPIIYAIMEQESAFNPMAKSWVPAYGLMQLVPVSGARDAYSYVYKKDKILSGDYLYDANNNIELGAAYLKVLKTRNFSKVTDPRSQLLCMIASYNCGAGNVSRAIIGSTNLPKAIPEINKMSYEQLYSHFSSHLPDETKGYIRKVTNNIKKYSK